MKKSIWGSYFAPTPALFRKIGDTLLAVALFLQVQPELIGNNNNLVVGSLIVGKFLTNFFKDAPSATDQTPSTEQ